MNDDFYHTAVRMWTDANILYRSEAQKSWFNTCYLVGYVLECYGKLLLILAEEEDVKKNYSHDIKKMNKFIVSHIMDSHVLAPYRLDLRTECPTIVSGHHKWDPVHRYQHGNGSWDAQAIANSYINEAQTVHDMVIKMKLDGVI